MTYHLHLNAIELNETHLSRDNETTKTKKQSGCFAQPWLENVFLFCCHLPYTMFVINWKKEETCYLLLKYSMSCLISTQDDLNYYKKLWIRTSFDISFAWRDNETTKTKKQSGCFAQPWSENVFLFCCHLPYTMFVINWKKEETCYLLLKYSVSCLISTLFLRKERNSNLSW